VLPIIDHLSSEIHQLKENIEHEATPLEKTQERSELASVKETLLSKIKGHHKQIELLKKKVHELSIDGDELAREFEENKIAI
jgi:DNA repair exonuclease SbcCD ATPase subunit